MERPSGVNAKSSCPVPVLSGGPIGLSDQPAGLPGASSLVLR